jgi:hypothetical protein
MAWHGQYSKGDTLQMKLTQITADAGSAQFPGTSLKSLHLLVEVLVK